jgi:thiol-disulfide isomerase/thioredoxin
MNKMKTDVGSKFMNVHSYKMDGKKLSLSSVVGKGKYVMLEFWASWCGPCKGEIPYMKEAYSKYHSKGFEIYSISIDRKEDAWKKASEEHHIPWINTLNIRKKGEDAQTIYGVKGVPANFLIGPDGKIVAKSLRGKALSNKLEELLGSK